MYPKPLLPVVFITLMVTACGPLVPLTHNKGNTDSPLFQVIETEEATVFLEFIETEHSYYVFDLEVVNRSQNALWVAPQLICMYASPKPFAQVKLSTDVHALSAPNSALTMKRQFANSPEATRKIYREKVKSARAGALVFAILGLGLSVYDAAKDSEDSKKETWTEKDQQKSIGRDLLVDAAFTASDIALQSSYRAQDDSHYIPYELFPESYLHANKSVRGKIFIPKESSYRFSRVVIPFGETDYVFDFKRQGVKIKQ